MTFLNTRAPRGHLLCKNLRCKEMYYEELVRASDPLVTDCAADTHVYWCLKTCRQESPQGAALSLDACSPDRACYER
jgi:hypothetical protein